MSAIFPDPRLAPPDEPLAMGQDFRPATLVEAYRNGIFPWPDAGGDVFWWSPDPRAVFRVGTVKRSRSLRQALRRDDLDVTFDRNFAAVVAACADRPGEAQ